jgi:hypothetical protein
MALAQVLWSALLIHLTGGRIETHFHVFVSLAFLAFDLDWTVPVTATVVVAGRSSGRTALQTHARQDGRTRAGDE